MRRIVLTFGFISGALISAMMAATLPFAHSLGNGGALLLGYTTMVLAFLLVYFGVRQYRDTVGGGRVSFGRALAVGGAIAAISSLCYVATWEVYFFGFNPGFLAEYQAHELDKARAAGASPAELARTQAENERFAERYRNPAFNAAMTLMEPLPVALVMALFSAGVLSRKRRESDAEDASGQREALRPGVG